MHPDSRCHAATNIDVDAAFTGDRLLELAYGVVGNTGAIRWPPAETATRRDGLWRHTCFELFVRASAGGPYYEFNFSPSTQWAAFRFASYRHGMCAAAVARAPLIGVQPDGDRYTLRVALESDCLPDLPRDAAWQIGLSAVIEGVDGRTSYWALAHAPGRPDFHHSDCFALELWPAGHP